MKTSLKIRPCNKRVITGCLCVMLVSAYVAPLNAQELRLDRQVVGSTGYSVQIGNIIFQYTVGEAAVATLLQPFLLTQGFQQPDVTVGPQKPQQPSVTDFVVFPNPASTYTTIRFDLFAPSNVRFMLVNNAGQIVYSEDRKLGAGKVTHQVPLEQYASGLYYVVLTVDSGKKHAAKLIIQ